jgi:hypothetical protein
MMVATCQEVMEQEDHEARIGADPEYAFKHRAASIYGDLREFEQFLDDFQITPLIARELLRAINEVENALLPTPEVACIAKSEEDVVRLSRRNVSIRRSRHALREAVSRIKAEIDEKIAYAVENGK